MPTHVVPEPPMTASARSVVPNLSVPAAGGDASNAKTWRIPAIDGFRALAALMVFGIHAYTFAKNPHARFTIFGHRMDIFGIFDKGSYGVDLFMVLSGFCLFWPLCRSSKALNGWDWRSFYRRRARRIIPPYYAAIVFASIVPNVFVLVLRATHTHAHWQRLPGSPFAYLAHLLFVQTLFTQSFGKINASLWSMALEVQFYLLFPLVILGFRRFGFRAVAAIAAASILYNLVAFPAVYGGTFVHRQMVRSLFLGRWIEFAAGMCAAWIVAHHRLRGRTGQGWIGTAAFVAALGVYAVAASLSNAPWALDSLLMGGIFAVAIVAVCATRTPVRRLFENRVMDRLGYISYSFFLVHWPVTYYTAKLFQKTHLHGVALFAAIVATALPAVYLTARVFFVLFERPFLSTSQKRRGARDLHHLAADGGPVTAGLVTSVQRFGSRQVVTVARSSAQHRRGARDLHHFAADGGPVMAGFVTSVQRFGSRQAVTVVRSSAVTRDAERPGRSYISGDAISNTNRSSDKLVDCPS